MMALLSKRWFSLASVLVLFAACGSSKTADQISKFADKICACPDAACATSVEVEYLAWHKDNQRARGSEGDRKDVEKAMERYAKCHNQLVGPAPVVPAAVVPKVDLSPPPAPEAALPTPEEDGERASEDDSAPAKIDPPTR